MSRGLKSCKLYDNNTEEEEEEDDDDDENDDDDDDDDVERKNGLISYHECLPV
jgi:hypothetical protein